jgi:alkaline phosphatase
MAHSHNDYEQALPYWLAYNSGFGSIEADIFLIGDSVLLVAHDSSELSRNMKMEDAYIKPLLQCLEKNKGFPYPDSSQKLQMLIDVKTDSIRTLERFVGLLQKYPSLIRSNAVRWVITGNRPDPLLFDSFPSFILFDGVLSRNYPPQALQKIVLFSDDFKKYSHWNGLGALPRNDEESIKAGVLKSHRLGKPVRFWNAPDQPNAWRCLIEEGVDYINTDSIRSLSLFLAGRSDYKARK